MIGIVPIVLIAFVFVILVVLAARRGRQDGGSLQRMGQATPLNRANEHHPVARASVFEKRKPFVFPSNAKKSFAFPSVPLKRVTVRDPMTGIKASGATRGGALANLEGKTGRKVDNPLFRNQ